MKYIGMLSDISREELILICLGLTNTGAIDLPVFNKYIKYAGVLNLPVSNKYRNLVMFNKYTGALICLFLINTLGH